MQATNDETTNIPVFPVSRYRYDSLRCYFPYGNTPAEDLLRCTEEKQPHVLLLGCGDIRSCFYTLWKNFDVTSNLQEKFSGIDFVLNDYCTSVLARNIVFIYLCLQLPSDEEERKKWLSAMWAIWYCHELYPEHNKILDESLKSLLKYSKSPNSWACSKNPLHNIVRFTSSSVFTDICEVWKSWCRKGSATVKQMHTARNLEYRRSGLAERMSKYTSEPSVVLSRILRGDTASIETYEIPEVISYINSGNCYAECVFDVTLVNSLVSINPTLLESKDGIYNIEFGCTLPFRAYHLVTKISHANTKQVGIGTSVCDAINSENFQLYPFLATCVQQFSMWIQSSSAVFKEKGVSLTFTCNNQHALTFCHKLLQSNKCSHDTSKSLFDAIFSSNLLDSLSPPNLILSALPLLKPGGSLFTTAFHFDAFACEVDNYLSMCFGFDVKLFPIILGAQWTEFDSTAPMKTLIQLNRNYKIVVWKQLLASQIESVSTLPPYELDNLTEGLLNSAVTSIVAFFPHPITPYLDSDRQLVMNSNCAETGMLVLQTFKLLAKVSEDFRFWQPMIAALHKVPSLECILAGLQTQAVLHNLHIHFGYPCPICRHVPVEYLYGLFCAEFPVPSDEIYSVSNFMVFVHSSRTLPLQNLDVSNLSRKVVQIIDSFDGVVDGAKIKLKFYAPLLFVNLDMNVTVARFLLRDEGNNVAQKVLLATKIRTIQITFERYYFSCISRGDMCDPKDFTSTEFNETQVKCSYCGRFGRLRKCSQCEAAQYCSKECQVQHWSKHKSDCQRSI